MSSTPGGYAGKILRVDLTRGEMTGEPIEEATLRKHIGGVGLGAKYLYEEVPPNVKWSDPENRLIFATGPLTGTQARGSSNITAMGKGPLTDGAASSQGNGFFAAYLKLAGYDAIIVQGASRKPVYLYIHDGVTELRDASHLVDKDTVEIDETIRQELGAKGRQVSVLCTGPAAEKLVKFAGLVTDGAHSCSHNGLGAVMGSKKLKAIAVARGKGPVAVNDREKLSSLAEEIFEAALKERMLFREKLNIPPLSEDKKTYWATTDNLRNYAAHGVLPVKNCSTNIFPEHATLCAPELQTHYEIIERNPCWRCRMIHSNKIRVTKGHYAGFEGKEPEYSHMGVLGSNLGITDPGAIVMLTDVVERLGFEVNEAAFTISWIMECFEKGLLGAKETGGLQMTWGNAEAAKAMLYRIVKREGFGDVLAEGLKRAAESVGGKAAECANYTRRGTTPGAHDERPDLMASMDIVFSNTGWREHRFHSRFADFDLPPVKDPNNPEEASTGLASIKGAQQFYNSVGVCIFCTKPYPKLLAQMVAAATGWDFTLAEAFEAGRRTVNLLRAFNIRHGLTPDQEVPSTRYGSAPVDGPAKGKAMMPHWEFMQRNYYEKMGWDSKTGKPLPETLEKFGLEYAISDIWK
ncbi:MAG: hypothetical protein HYX79_02695 [Chloroflexi bacterium]|nr:hypothetical protein [Chloroflexota bacterium]